MRIDVDMEVCQHYGQCVFAAPDVFDLDENAELRFQATASDDRHEDVEAAVAACPVQAITILAS
jgi:ferredoxin